MFHGGGAASSSQQRGAPNTAPMGPSRLHDEGMPKPPAYRTPRALDDDQPMTGWPEYGVLDGKQVRLTRGNLRRMSPSDQNDLLVDFGEGPIRPMRFGSGPDEIQAEPGKPLRI